MKYLAILRDSFREAVDRKSFAFMVVLAAVLILFCLGISFSPLDEREALASLTENFNLVTRSVDLGRAWATRHDTVAFEILDFRKEGAGTKPLYRVKMRASPAVEANRLVRHWQAVRMGKCKAETDPVPEADVAVGADLQKRFLAIKLREATIPDVEVESAGDWTWDLSLGAAGPHTLAGAEKMKLFFGAVTWRPRFPGPVPSSSRFMSSAEVVYWIQHVMGELMAGFVGLLIAVIVTSSAIPGFLQKGTLDLILSKPVDRSVLLFVKYLGGCIQVLLTSLLIIGGCWLAISLRTGYWNPYVPLTALTLTFSFAVLYSVSVLMGVLTRSTPAAALSTLLVWGLCWGVGQGRAVLASPLGAGAPGALEKTIRFVHLLLPKTTDMAMFNDRLVAKGGLGVPPAESMLEVIPQFPMGMILLTSGLFVAVLLSLACAKFSKNDY